MKFISASSVSESDPGAEAELEAWDSLRRVFDSSEDGILYHQYPIIEKGGERFDSKPDFVLLHRRHGLAILECKGYTIDQIDRIEGDTWYLQGISQRTATPLEQARQQGYHLRSYFQRERELQDDRGRSVVSMTPIVLLPNVERSEWEERGFGGPSEPRIITGDEMGEVALREHLDNYLPEDSLDSDQYRAARGVLSCGQAISGEPGKPTPNPQSRGEYYERITKGIRELDTQQQRIGLQIPPGPQQIRGIAGSGKTILLAKKAARMLSEPNEWTAADTDPEDVRIAFSFNSKSLYQSLTKQIERFYRHFTDEPLSEATATLDIIHAWGGRRTGDGIYYILARQIPDVSFHTFRQAGDAFPDSEDRMEAVASEVRETGNIPQIWDAILIDEAQDFGPEFFNMCLEATTSQNRLIWAYDEAQDLSSLTAPSPKNIFGTDDSGDPILDLSGQYRGGPQKTYVMRKSYRAPRSILMLAHAVGMGLKRKDGPLQAITRQSGWENLGYEIDADFRKIGSEAILRRPGKNSPHPIQNELQPSDLITHRSFASNSDELEYVAEQVRADVEKEGLKPEQVLVIPLSRSRRNGDSNRDYISEKLAEQLERHDITINAVWEENDKNFLNQGEVTLAGINRAKGNEAGSVYVLGVDAVSEEIWRDNEVHRRNELFVALTRSRGWISATGATPSSSIHTEFDSVIQDIDSTEPHISFEVPDSRDLSNELETDTEDLERTSLDEFV